MKNPISRRDALKSIAVVAGAAAGIESALAQTPARPAAATRVAAGPPTLDEKDPLAVALGYVSDATKVDAKKNPTFKAGQNCSMCLQLQGKAGDPWRPCNLFPGKLVASTGWCRTYVKKPGAKV